MTMEEKIERLREDIRRIALYPGAFFRLEVQVLDDADIGHIMKALSAEEMLRCEFRVIDQLPDWEPVIQQVSRVVMRAPKIEAPLPTKRIPPPIAKRKPDAEEQQVAKRIELYLREMHAVAGKHS